MELSSITGLTTPAIANITKRLLDDGLICEAGQVRGGRGQPATKYVIEPNACYSIGVNIDRDHVTCVIVNFAGETVARRTCDVMFAMPGDVQAIYSRWIAEMLEEAELEPAAFVGIGVAIPDDLGLIELPGKPAGYEEWSNIDPRSLFKEPLNLPIFAENDAAAAAMGEMQLGLGQEISSFFYILISLALGGGLVIDGSYFRGADGRSGEIGFLRQANVGSSSDQIQNVVSVSGLREHLRLKEIDPSVVLQPDGLTSPEVKDALDAWLTQATKMLVDPLVAVNCLINPGAVLIGGRLPTEHLERLASSLNEALGVHGLNAPAIAPVKRAALSADAPAVGGAILPFSQFLLPRASSLWKAAGPVSRAA